MAPTPAPVGRSAIGRRPLAADVPGPLHDARCPNSCLRGGLPGALNGESRTLSGVRTDSVRSVPSKPRHEPECRVDGFGRERERSAIRISVISPYESSRDCRLAGCLRDLSDLFQCVFGDGDQPAELHLRRIYVSRAWVFLSHNERGELLGASYVFRGGRRAAAAVHPAARSHGHYSELIRASVQQLQDQFVEVRVSQESQQRVLLDCGFRFVTSMERAEVLLGPLLLPLIEEVETKGIRVVYTRRSFDGQRRGRYCMLVHGSPSPTLQAEPYYPRSM